LTAPDVFGLEVDAASRVPSRWPAALPPPAAVDVARSVLLLGSDLSESVTGSTITVDGGVVMAP
jgi:enoyl-[acyl-carrier-protein] reductase (NADH)